MPPNSFTDIARSVGAGIEVGRERQRQQESLLDERLFAIESQLSNYTPESREKFKEIVKTGARNPQTLHQALQILEPIDPVQQDRDMTKAIKNKLIEQANLINAAKGGVPAAQNSLSGFDLSVLSAIEPESSSEAQYLDDYMSRRFYDPKTGSDVQIYDKVKGEVVQRFTPSPDPLEDLKREELLAKIAKLRASAKELIEKGSEGATDVQKFNQASKVMNSVIDSYEKLNENIDSEIEALNDRFYYPGDDQYEKDKQEIISRYARERADVEARIISAIREAQKHTDVDLSPIAPFPIPDLGGETKTDTGNSGVSEEADNVLNQLGR